MYEKKTNKLVSKIKMNNEMLKGKQQAKHKESIFHHESWQVKESKVGKDIRKREPSMGSWLTRSGFKLFIFDLEIPHVSSHFLSPYICQLPYVTREKTAVRTQLRTR